MNDTEMWQAASFDPDTMEEEMGWAERFGYNGARVFLQYLVWADDPAGFEERLDRFLDMADRHGIGVMPILFDDCAFACREPCLGEQDDPVPGVHNSGWVPSPGMGRVTDRSAWPDLERYVKGVVGAFADDARIPAWDLYNEPGNSGMGERSLPLVEAAFGWAREVNPSQPLTAGAWSGVGDFRDRFNARLMALSDVVSFHAYEDPVGVKGRIEACAEHGRPVLCTEWLKRQDSNTFGEILPLFDEHGVGWYHWGLVAGRTQTYMPWGSKPGDSEPDVWQHDVLHPDGRPYDEAELRLVLDGVAPRPDRRS